MKPATICTTILGTEKLEAVLDLLTSPQIKSVLKEGGVKAKVPGGYVSRPKRRKIWGDRLLAALRDDNDDLASELLQQWLLNHRRQMLVDYLDRLGVKHRQGETDDSFLVTSPAEKVQDAARWLLGEHDRTEALAYLHYVAYQQRTAVFDEWEETRASSGGASD